MDKRLESLEKEADEAIESVIKQLAQTEDEFAEDKMACSCHMNRLQIHAV